MATPAVTVAAMMNRGEVTIRRKGTDAVNALVPFFCFSFLKKEQKVMSFSLAPRKELKETSTLTKP